MTIGERDQVRHGAGARSMLGKVPDLLHDRARGRLHRLVRQREDLVDPPRGDDVPLTSREFALIGFLMRRRGDVVSKRAIVENVWDVKTVTRTSWRST
jgi:DNA-binding response OmpR family regulator